MVIKGNARGGAAQLAGHLQRLDTNEHMNVVELRGVLATDLNHALAEMEAVASGTRSQRPFYHASINTRADEVMTVEQRHRAIDQLEAALGLTDQARAVVEHVKEGRAHVHIVWSRIDLERMTAIPDSFNYRRHEECARELEREFGHARVQGAHVERDDAPRPDRTPTHAEMQQAERTGRTPQAMKAEVTALWQATDSGQAFAAAIDDAGLVLARGDKRDFVIVDEAGEVHSLARRIDGAKAKDVRGRMADVDAASLPDIEQAKLLQRARGSMTKEQSAAPSQGSPVEPEIPAPEIDMPEFAPRDELEADRGEGDQSVSDQIDHPMTEEDRRALAQAEAERQAAAAKAEQDRVAAAQKEEATKQEEQQATAVKAEQDRLAAVQKEDAAKRQQTADEQQRSDALRAADADRLAQQNADRLAEQARELQQLHDQRLERYADALQQQAIEARQYLRSQQEIERQREGEVQNAGERYSQALGRHYDMRDPYGSLARAAMAEHAAFRHGRHELSRQIATTADPVMRGRLETRQQIELAEYMAITSDRIAVQSEVIVGRSNTDEALLQRERADTFRKEAEALREQLREMPAAKEALNTPANLAPAIEPAQAAAQTPEPLMVVDTKAPDAAPQPLAEFVKDLDLPKLPPVRSLEERMTNPVARQEHLERQAKEAQRSIALDKISRAVAENKPITADSLRALHRHDVEGIKRDGDKHMQWLVKQREQEREKQAEAFREL